MSKDVIDGLVCAECKSCGLKHLQRSRIEHIDGPASTECPKCRSVRYRTFIAESVPDELVDREREIERLLGEVDGVGNKAVENIKDRFEPLILLEQIEPEQLAEVKYVGMEKAERIQSYI
jgi:ERCC4-type nuclease